MAEQKYAIKWLGKSGSTYRGVDAQVIGETLTEMSANRQHSRVKPEEIVDAARPVKAPLHPCFNWDDKLAAEKWRVVQARQLVRVVVLVREEEPEREPIRAFVSLKEEEAGEEEVIECRAYIPMIEALGDSERRGKILKQAKMEMEAWRRRYEHLDEFARVFEAIDQVSSPDSNGQLHLGGEVDLMSQGMAWLGQS